MQVRFTQVRYTCIHLDSMIILSLNSIVKNLEEKNKAERML
jgi:hypothetical protein